MQMDALQKEVIAEHYRLIQQLETKYTDQINQLLKQKALALYTKLLEINSMCPGSTNSSSNNGNPSASTNLYQCPSLNVNANNNAVHNAPFCNIQSLINKNGQSSANHHSSPLNTSLHCNQCNLKFQTKADYDFHQSMHTLLPLIGNQTQTSVSVSVPTVNVPNLPPILPIKSEDGFIKNQQTKVKVDRCYDNDGDTVGENDKKMAAIKPFECTKCGKRFRQKRELNRHVINKHTPNHAKPFKCRYCDYGAATKSIVQRHEYTHSSTKPYQCTLCTYQTSYKYILKKHLKKVHDAEESESVECSLSEPPQLNGNGSTNGKKWKCQHCDKRFTAKSLMKQHELIHSGPKNFKCDQCDFASAHKRSLTRHKLLHSAPKPFSCTVCSKQFRTKHLMEQHAKTHSSPLKNAQ